MPACLTCWLSLSLALCRAGLELGEGRSAAAIFQSNDYNEFQRRMGSLGWAWCAKEAGAAAALQQDALAGRASAVTWQPAAAAAGEAPEPE